MPKNSRQPGTGIRQPQPGEWVAIIANRVVAVERGVGAKRRAITAAGTNALYERPTAVSA